MKRTEARRWRRQIRRLMRRASVVSSGRFETPHGTITIHRPSREAREQ